MFPSLMWRFSAFFRLFFFFFIDRKCWSDVYWISHIHFASNIRFPFTQNSIYDAPFLIDSFISCQQWSMDAEHMFSLKSTAVKRSIVFHTHLSVVPLFTHVICVVANFSSLLLISCCKLRAALPLGRTNGDAVSARVCVFYARTAIWIRRVEVKP